jgi:hypothetical protein
VEIKPAAVFYPAEEHHQQVRRPEKRRQRPPILWGMISSWEWFCRATLGFPAFRFLWRAIHHSQRSRRLVSMTQPPADVCGCGVWRGLLVCVSTWRRAVASGGPRAPRRAATTPSDATAEACKQGPVAYRHDSSRRERAVGSGGAGWLTRSGGPAARPAIGRLGGGSGRPKLLCCSAPCSCIICTAETTTTVLVLPSRLLARPPSRQGKRFTERRTEQLTCLLVTRQPTPHLPHQPKPVPDRSRVGVEGTAASYN